MPAPAAISVVCFDCQQDLEHCHGTALVHPDGSVECADDPDCRLGRDLHVSEADCADADCPCGLPEPTGFLYRATA